MNSNSLQNSPGNLMEHDASRFNKLSLGSPFSQKKKHNIFKNIHVFFKAKNNNNNNRKDNSTGIFNEEYHRQNQPHSSARRSTEDETLYNDEIVSSSRNSSSLKLKLQTAYDENEKENINNGIVSNKLTSIISSENALDDNNILRSPISKSITTNEINILYSPTLQNKHIRTKSISSKVGTPLSLSSSSNSRRNSFSNINNTINNIRIHRSDSIKKERKSSSKINLRRINSMYSSQKDIKQPIQLHPHYNDHNNMNEKYTYLEDNKYTSYNPTTDTQSLKFSNKMVTPRNSFDSVLSGSHIPHYEDDNNSHDFFKRISPETLNEIINKKTYKPYYDSYTIIDCRFDYEYKGGHIKNAINLSTRDDLETELLKKYYHSIASLPTLLIFHCEFSAHRGPKLASHLRNCDRMLNYETYPKLYYPDILILDGGYEQFFEKFPESCYPQNYIAMDSQENLLASEKSMDLFRSDSKKFSTRNNSLRKLTSVSISTTNSLKSKLINNNTTSASCLLFNNTKGNDGSNITSPSTSSFPLVQPPKLSLAQYPDSENDAIGDRSSPTTSASRLSMHSTTSSFGSSRSRLLLMEECNGILDDTHSYFSFQDGCSENNKNNDRTLEDDDDDDDDDANLLQGAELTMTNSNSNLMSNNIFNVNQFLSSKPVKRSLFPNIPMEEEEVEGKTERRNDNKLNFI
ncbi:putative tyrosine protein phosphatase MIH1 NDAI_0B01350 [Naumovozyma dairenensis CBS 421]|uniref:M-phase inducer phosphatase n=1 Tax=Naumovozyma dairenensis (strain ATCC 10597 / BCRC 20456 / CBS 421 / NBRC 0211 / NRRL Y-12639) TaxID=1071378 RepID=G0W5V8_NAUDC|nr:hypothetical protein NDAI_0B01350 [Naumovozyma dairenensis CBS 421]CCD23169.1 hypothetical protein NDAI_0B01350 [Naumovozyma dairenensis CBS 421]